MKSSRNLLVLVAITCIAAVAFAVASQSWWKMQPCAWCIFQRVLLLGIAAVCIVGVLWRQTAGRMLTGALALLLALSGIASALWQHFHAASALSCDRSLAERIIGALDLENLWPRVFAVRASCADAAASLLGIPYDWWSLTLFALIAVVCIRIMRRA
jgi:disulfide bond formation protein DsbB